MHRPRLQGSIGMGALAAATLVCCNCLLGVVVVRRAFQQLRRKPDTSPKDVNYNVSVPASRSDNVSAASVIARAAANGTSPPQRAAVGPAEPLCSRTSLCKRLDAYLMSRLAPDQDPCEDFYGYVCSRRWPVSGQPDDAPYLIQATTKLMYEMPKTLERYFALRERSYHDYPGVFLNQAVFFLPNCTSAYSRNGLGWDPWQELLRTVGLPGWPYQRKAAGSNVSATAATLDAMLGVFPFVQVRVKSEYEPCCAVQLDTPSTIYKRNALWHSEEDAQNYTAVVARALSLLDLLPDVDDFAHNLVTLEMRLEDALATRRPTSKSAYREVEPDALPHARGTWHWGSYLARLLAGGNSGDSNNAVNSVEVVDLDYFNRLAEIMENTSCTTLFNYMGYRTLVHLSPLLPDDAAFLVALSLSDPVRNVPERFQACVHLLEHLYPFGMRTFLRMSLGEENPLRYATHFDVQMKRIFNETLEFFAKRAAAARWLNPVERIIAREKIANMEFVFMGTIIDLNVPAAYYNPNAPEFLGAQLLQSYVDIQSNTRRVYYNPWFSDQKAWDYDNRYHVSSLRPGYEYVHGKNHLYVPYAVVAFLKGLSKEVDPVFLPVVVPFLMRGMFEALNERGSSVDHQRRVRDWWSKESYARFSAIKDCLFKQYKTAMGTIAATTVDLVRDLDQLMADNAVLDPLYDYYLRRLSTDARGARATRSSVAGLTYEQLFYVNYAAASCDQRGPGYERRRVRFGEAPARARVNIALRNHKNFATSFGCQPRNDMNPAHRCSVW